MRLILICATVYAVAGYYWPRPLPISRSKNGQFSGYGFAEFLQQLAAVIADQGIFWRQSENGSLTHLITLDSKVDFEIFD